jgi:hypothetical protein
MAGLPPDNVAHMAVSAASPESGLGNHCQVLASFICQESPLSILNGHQAEAVYIDLQDTARIRPRLSLTGYRKPAATAWRIRCALVESKL